MKHLLIIAAIAFFGFTANVSAKEAKSAETATQVFSNTQSLKGIISDIATNESLAGAIITANGQKVYSDLDGNFSIKNICNGKCQLKISMISYEDKILDIDFDSNSQVNIKLSQR